jgi:hypothetical protein
MEIEGTYESLTPFADVVTVDQYHSFIEQLPSFTQFSPDISRIKSEDAMTESTIVAASLFSNLIQTVNDNLSDKTKGIAVVDIASSINMDSTEDAYWGVVLALSLTNNIFRPSRDRINGTPYTIYVASHQNSSKLARMGLPRIAPEEKLGFHTDGLLSEHNIAMPHHIMLYNIAIEYQRPGNFYWIPFSLWEEKHEYSRLIGIGDRYKIAVTPSVYQIGVDELERVSPQHVNVPIFVDSANLDYPVYINGTVIERSDRAEFDMQNIIDMKESLTKNPRRFAVPQKTRRIVFARNVAGAHARDVFQQPNEAASYTRVFMRSVDHHCVEL